jgi:type I restriction enzyme, S subunit
MSSEGWETVLLGDISQFRYGKMPDKRLITNEDDYPVFSGYKINGYYPKYNCEADKLIVVARGVGGTGDVKITKEKCWLTNLSIEFLLDDDKVSVPFLYYYFLKDTLRHLDSGSAQSQITIDDLKRIYIELPDLSIQRHIADILSALDEKIELNRQTNTTLEAIAQAIFKEWFVDFNFPDATGDMVESEVGMIPHGWYINEVEELFEVKDGTHDSPKFMSDGYYLITSRHLRKDGQIDFLNANRISVEDFKNINRRSKVDYLDILYSMIGTVGNILLVGQRSVDFAIKNMGLFKTSQRPELVLYMNYYMKTNFSEKYFRERLSGSTQQYVTLKTLRELPVLIPDENTISSFNNILWPIFEKIQANLEQAQILNQTRDALLPKLMSGEIEV